ncbi:MAG TPA: sigma-70 family RNA polymerase sigma factor [Candidatus Limnocylindria bacterium]|nr:sigma-70 family RNA polymerase sigma factor [Candidatus Limnocylindria bacterium]
MHDRALVDAVLAGDRDMYRLLVERESRAVIGVCLRVLGDSDEAQDAAQDAFVQAFRSLAGYRGDGTFGAWVGRIARRIAVARATAAGRHVTTDVEAAADLVRDDSADPLEHLMDVEQSVRLHTAVDALPADQRQVVSLRFFNDMPLERIAVETHVPLGTVKSRLHRALARLREQGDLRPLA